MSIIIRDVREHELDLVLALNNAAGPGILPMDAGKLRFFWENADYFRVAEKDGHLAGFLVAVSQDVFMFAGTLRGNIGLDDGAIDDERILSAARRVGADRVIASRPEGLDARVLERGANFSAGDLILRSSATSGATSAPLLP